MTIFSASTFVVWGGVAYRSGIVAIVIALMLGFASIMVGRLLAGKWSKLNIHSPAEYLGIRFGQGAIRCYTAAGIVGRGVHTAVALYAIAIMVVALMPLPAGHFLADPATGKLSVTYAVLILGAITFIYTAAGGFLAVLMTDVVQFAVLIAMIIIMVPLSFNDIGGIKNFVEQAPEGFFSLFNAPYTWVWMVLWLLLNFFMIGGDWSFVQRYISVPTAKDAKKSVYLVGALYFVTPLIWYVPALVYRVIDPNASPEQSYMLMCQRVLGAGMLGMMLAAMISATLSLVSGTLNVYANVFTCDIYSIFRPNASEKSKMRVGRSFTYIYGLLITAMAAFIPVMGGAERVAVSILTLVISPLFIPSIWGLFSKRIGSKAVWSSMCITYFLGLLLKIGFSGSGLLTDAGDTFRLIAAFVAENVAFVDAFIGLVIPVTILIIIEIFLRNKQPDAGYLRYVVAMNRSKTLTDKNKAAGTMYSSMAFKIMMWTYIAIGLTMLLLAFGSGARREQMFIFAAVFCGVPAVAFLIYKLFKHKTHETV